MTVIFENQFGWFLDVENYLNEEFENVEVNFQIKNLKINEKIFEINHPFLYDSQFNNYLNSSLNQDSQEYKRKRKRKKYLNQTEETKNLEIFLIEAHKKLLQNLNQTKETKSENEISRDNNLESRQFAVFAQSLQSLFQKYSSSSLPSSSSNPMIIEIEKVSNKNLKGNLIKNTSSVSKQFEISSHCFLIPPCCSFLLSDFSDISLLIKANQKFDCILMDPPWENKSVKRKKTYQTINNINIMNIPINKLSNSRCLLVLWLTNKKKLFNHVTNDLFKIWNVYHWKVWYWVKVTKDYKLVNNLPSSENSKKPYEIIIIAHINNDISISDNNNVNNFENINNNNNNKKVIFSIPSSIHSHKPPLHNIINKMLPDNSKCLELFGRSLHSNWVTWGNEFYCF